MRQRLQAKLRALREELRVRSGRSIRENGRWLGSVLQGYYRHFAVPRNLPAMTRFHHRVGQLWRRALARRSHKGLSELAADGPVEHTLAAATTRHAPLS